MRVVMVGALAVVLASAGGVVGVGVVAAQEARPADAPVPLEIKRGPKPPRPIVRPDSDGSQATRDAATAAAEYEQRQRDEAIVREQTQQVPRRPDLGYDVTSGIQQRNILRR